MQTLADWRQELARWFVTRRQAEEDMALASHFRDEYNAQEIEEITKRISRSEEAIATCVKHLRGEYGY